MNMNNEEPKNKTKSDAYKRVSTAMVGAFKNASKEYLTALRAYLVVWIEEVDIALGNINEEQPDNGKQKPPAT